MTGLFWVYHPVLQNVARTARTPSACLVAAALTLPIEADAPLKSVGARLIWRGSQPLGEPETTGASMAWHEAFNRSPFSHFINSPEGRVFRVTAGAAFLVAGYFFRAHPLGLLSMLWSVLPLTAGSFDLCYISAVLGGPLSGRTIRERQKGAQTPRAAG